MKTLRFLLRAAGLTAILLGPLGLLSAALNAGLLSAIHRAVTATQLERSLLFAFAGFGFGRIAVAYLSTMLLGDHAARAVTALRRDLIERLISVPHRELERVGPGRVHAALSHDVSVLEGALSSVPQMVTYAAVLLGGALYLTYLSPRLFVTLGLALVPCFVVFRAAARYAEAAHARQRNAYDRLFSHFRALTDGAKELKLHAARRAAFLQGPVRQTTQELLDHDVEMRGRYARAGVVNQLLVLGVLGAVLFVLPQGSALRSEVDSGYLLVGLYVLGPLAALSRTWPLFRAAEISLRNLEELGLRLHAAPDEARADPTARPDATCVELRDACYRYDDARAFQLGPLSLRVERGKVLFIVGGNGSGKTTLARMLTGLYPPSEGALLWDGAPVDASNRDLYRQLWSAVFFDHHLFDRAYGVDDAVLNARGPELLHELDLAPHVRLAGGAFSTLDLSQGQRKRLGLWLALLDDRPFYLFDEWAAEQEPEHKRRFYRELLPELRARGKGVVVITHDDRYFDAADVLVTLRDGASEVQEPAIEPPFAIDPSASGE